MQLKHVFIKEYKNLKDFEITFNGSSFIDVFVGKNGSGKSNFFEALINIFHHLQDDEDTKFDYEIVYEIDGKDIKVEWKWEEQKRFVNDKEQKSFPKTLLPDNVIVYYSGHNKQVSNLIKQYEASFSKKIKGASIEDTRFFIGIGSEYKNILLTLLLIQDSSNKASHHLKTKMKIKAITPNFNIILKRPLFANSRLKALGFDNIDNFEISTHYWGADGITFDLLKQLEKCIKGSFTHGDIYDREKDEYNLPIDIELFQKEFQTLGINDKFRMFDNLKTLDMLKGISMELELENGTSLGIEEFSDGQFQSIYIYAVTEIFKELNCLTLLDEPDAFLHPEWQQMFFDQISHIISDSVNNHILMTTHSASTLIPFDDNNINLFCITDSKVIWTKQSKKETINELSNSFIQYSEDESKLLIDNVIRTSSKPILFVEGPSDVSVLNTAYKNLYAGEDIPILIQDAFERGFLKTLFARHEVFSIYPNKKFFALFDFDDAYEDWRSLNSECNEETDISKGLCRKLANKNAYVFLLPIINNDLKQQVWDEENPTEKIVPKPHYCIEHIFWDSFEDKSTWFREKNGVKLFKGDKYKVKFAKEIVPTLPTESFEVFRPMFDFIKTKCGEN